VGDLADPPGADHPDAKALYGLGIIRGLDDQDENLTAPDLPLAVR
jgi:hypothetical protein